MRVGVCLAKHSIKLGRASIHYPITGLYIMDVGPSPTAMLAGRTDGVDIHAQTSQHPGQRVADQEKAIGDLMDETVVASSANKSHGDP